jgi:glycosyltransferase involved in cell wall biosynthesis
MSVADTKPTSCAVVIPMYNEEAGAEKCVRAVLAALSAIACRCELIVVEDGSKDSTATILDRLNGTLLGLVVIHHVRNSGYGAGLKTGADEARRRGFEYVLFMDSDLTNPPEDIGRFIEAMNRHVDVIKGCRFCKGGGMVGVPLKRQVMTRTARWISAALLRIGVTDCTNGFRAIKADVFTRMPLTERGFPIIMEELYWAKRMGCTFANVPTTLYTRSNDRRQSLFAYNYPTLAAYLKYAAKGAFVRAQRSER